MARAAGDGKRRARRVIARAPSFLGWNTTDQEEIERRRWRGRAEIIAVEAQGPDGEFFGTFRVRSASGSRYDVEIRALASLDNSCGCIDHKVNGLGTCKHIEGALFTLRRGRARLFDRTARRGSPRAEVYLRRHGEAGVRVLWPAIERAGALREALGNFFSDEGGLVGDALAVLPALRSAIAALPEDLRDLVRLSQHLEDWLKEERGRIARRHEREHYIAEAADGRAEPELLRHPLLPYQRDGMVHLAFGERALLADEMGLGKTVQAIAACELLRRRRGITRVLVVCPASLKAEWQEQIARFTDLSTRIVEGGRAKRLQAYRDPAFFNLGNYEQVIPDGPEINGILEPDVVILDEAQRIKNWQTKTARAVKGLKSPYAFVLTGTPLENRIDEVYSIVQYLDPGLLGPLFRFKRDFYQLDERGRPVDYRNLEELHRRLGPVMLRRRKREIEDQLPARTVTNYFVAMTAEQRLRYQDYEARAARLLAVARRRSLTKEEFDRLQKWLACMRMTCDTPYILDNDCRDCPKLEELEGILADFLAEPHCKVIVFSEWVRMLELVGELAREMDLDAAWHTGDVPQARRRAEIRRFKDDPDCRLLLSSDSGSVGLNLQAANVVINLDLPWNPAKLEQRIARAWRKYQHRSVSVINLVTEDSIEHRMLHLLAQKQGLAEGVLDGRGDLKALRMPSGRKAFIERLEAAMAAATDDAPPAGTETVTERLHADLVARHGDGLLLLEAHRDASGRESVLAVIDGAPGTAAQEIERLARELAGTEHDPDVAAPRVEVLDRAGFAALRRLADAGIVSFAGERRQLHRAPSLDDTTECRRQQLARARTLYTEAERKLRMAALLAGGGFAVEAGAPLRDAVTAAVTSMAVLNNGNGAGDTEPAASLSERTEDFVAKGLLGGEAVATVASIQACGADDEPAAAHIPALIDSAEGVLARVGTMLESALAP
ncbi:MAG: DEAD/DEAH box helicase [Rhodospirillales bacterium]|nr:DEAD/DEAH box helicase [Rhodospirillales bacterium]MDH3969122.1 DEAD/DEAH box helicase [Rhodospirillales bacterium]